MNGHRVRAIAAAIPLVLINVVAFAGQLAFLRAHLPWPMAGQVLMAVALESIAVFLALHAHAAALADDSALRLRLASYGFAAVIGAMNYSHYAGPGWRPTFPAAAVGLMSAASPWLWAVHSRRASRDALIARGLVEPHALRLGMTRWLWHPLRSARVMWLATWDGITDPRQAVARWEADRPIHAHPAGPGHRSQGPAAAGPGPAQGALPGPVPQAVPAIGPRALSGPVPDRPARRSGTGPGGRRKSRPRTGRARAVTGEDAEREFMSELAAGAVPSLTQVRSRLHVGYDRARQLRAHLETLART